MKIKIIDRILLALYALLGVAGAAAAVLLIVYRETFSINMFGASWAFGRELWPTAVILGAIGLVLLAWSIKIFALAFRHEPKTDHASVSVQNTEDGSVRISVAAMDTLIKQAIGHQEGILDVRSKIINHEDSISVCIDMTLTSDVHIPNVTMLLQRTVKNFVEEFSGIAVREVTVLVSSIVEVVPSPLALETKGDETPPADSKVEAVQDMPETRAMEEEETPSITLAEETTVEEAAILDEGSSYLAPESEDIAEDQAEENEDSAEENASGAADEPAEAIF